MIRSIKAKTARCTSTVAHAVCDVLAWRPDVSSFSLVHVGETMSLVRTHVLRVVGAFFCFQGTICVRFSDDGHEREQANNAIGYASNNGLLIAQVLNYLNGDEYTQHFVLATV